MLSAKWKVILLGLAFVMTAVISYNKGEASSDAVHAKAMAEHLLQDSENARTAELKQRNREESYNLVRDAQEAAANARVQSALLDRDNALRGLSSLSDRLAATDARLRRASEAARAAGVHEGTIQTALVLSKLFGEATQELQRVAGTADEWHVKATQCAAFYDEIRSR